MMPPGAVESCKPELEPPVSGSHAKAHIVHVVGTLAGAGVTNLVLGMAGCPALSNYRHSVVCAIGAQGPAKEAFQRARISAVPCAFFWPEKDPIPSYTISRWIRHSLVVTYSHRLAWRLRQMQADLVHSHISSHIHLQAHGVLRRARLPWVWTVHGRYKPEGKELARWREAGRIISEGNGCITAVSSAVSEDIKALQIAPPERIRTVYGGIDLSRFNGSVARSPEWRERRGIPNDAVLFGSVGRLVPEKAHDVFIAAAARLIRTSLAAQFVIAGEGRCRAALEADIKRLGMERHFHLIGYEADVPHFLAQLDVFVMPSRTEGLGIALLEALASGLPCIATDVGGIPEILGQAGGLLVPADSTEKLAEAMSAMLEADMREAFAAKGRKIAERFSIDDWSEKFCRIYTSLLK
jgi:glycosyltransferase involved in cell wall biosynthesis